MIDAPEGRLGLRGRHDGPPREETAPAAFSYPVPRAIPPPDGPLLTDCVHGYVKPQSAARRATRVCHPRLTGHGRGGRELRSVVLNLGLRENWKRCKVVHRSHLGGDHTGFAEPVTVETARIHGVLHVADQSVVTECRQLLGGPPRPRNSVCEDVVEPMSVPRALRVPAHEAAADVLKENRQPTVHCFEIEAVAPEPPPGGLLFQGGPPGPRPPRPPLLQDPDNTGVVKGRRRCS